MNNFKNWVLHNEDLINAISDAKTHCVTCSELFRDYGITKQTCSRYIRSGKLHAFKLGYQTPDNKYWRIEKWYIEKDELLDDFIEKCRLK